MGREHRDFHKHIPLSDRRRAAVLALCLFGLLSLLLVQFYKIQIMEGEKWQRVADGQHYVVVTEPFKRGQFFAKSRRGASLDAAPLVVDLERFHLYADPKSIPKTAHEAVSQQLSRILGSSRSDEAKLRQELKKKSRSRKLCMWLKPEEREQILNWWRPFAKERKIARNGLYFVRDFKRSHPFGHLLGPVLHTIQEVKDEVTMQGLPTGGLELAMNGYLKGTQGKRRMMRSPRNALAIDEVLESPKNGADIYLSVDPVLQAICEEEVAIGVQAARAKAGWAVMMEPNTGEILAIAQYPFFDPDDYRGYFNDPAKVWLTKVKAITDAYEPGSTIKPLNLAIALEANVVRKQKGQPPIFFPEEKVKTSDGRFPGRSKPVKDVRLHRYLNMYMALQKSSNIYLSTMVQRLLAAMGPDWYVRGLKTAFGLGERIGVNLPAESPGMVPDPFSPQEGRIPSWTQGTPISMAFGYNLQVTTLQMVRAYAILANGGYRVDPFLVSRVVQPGPNGQELVLLENKINKVPERVLSPETVAEVVKALKYVTKPGGGAFRADIPGYTQAGKTGTTKKLDGGVYSSDKYFATFVGFAPVENPRFVILVAIDEPEVFRRPGSGMNYYGGVCAAPVFRDLAKRSLKYLGVPADDPYGYPPGDPRHNRDLADWEQERRELEALYEEWNG